MCIYFLPFKTYLKIYEEKKRNKYFNHPRQTGRIQWCVSCVLTIGIQANSACCRQRQHCFDNVVHARIKSRLHYLWYNLSLSSTSKNHVRVFFVCLFLWVFVVVVVVVVVFCLFGFFFFCFFFCCCCCFFVCLFVLSWFFFFFFFFFCCCCCCFFVFFFVVFFCSSRFNI